MNRLDELLATLSYAECRQDFPLPYLYHGCLFQTWKSICQSGLICTQNEPCLTYHPGSALLKYANPGRNSVFQHAQKMLSPATGAVWDGDPEGGAALLFDAGRIPVVPSARGSIHRTPERVAGGVTKWLYCHLSPSGNGRIVVPADTILAVLHPGKAWDELLERADPRAQNRLDTDALADELRPLCANAAAVSPVRANPDAETLARGIARGACCCALLNQLRRLLLAALGADRPVVKTDYAPEPEIWPVLPAEEALRQLASLSSVRYSDAALEQIKQSVLRELTLFFLSK